MFTTIQNLKAPFTVTIADGSEVTVQGIGDVFLYTKDLNSTLPNLIKVRGVCFMPDLNINLLSVSRLEDNEIFIRSRPGSINLTYQERIVSTAIRTRGSYALELYKEVAYTSLKAPPRAPKPARKALKSAKRAPKSAKKVPKSTYAIKEDKIIQDADS